MRPFAFLGRRLRVSAANGLQIEVEVVSSDAIQRGHIQLAWREIQLSRSAATRLAVALADCEF
ncbi:hypothetical protein P3T24_004167 [Paraburkholderia sp. GAS33]|jgi:hypothetical protein